ncbi:hypothetical protein DL96DRAFT_1589913, partial [Flagelloscypha sp. PMI_526]
MELGGRRAIVLVLVFIPAAFSKTSVWVMVFWARTGITSASLKTLCLAKGAARVCWKGRRGSKHKSSGIWAYWDLRPDL